MARHSVKARRQGRRTPVAAKLGAGAIAILSLIASIDFYQSSERLNRAYQDPYKVNLQEERFREFARAVPPDAMLGYISDLPFGQPAGDAAFFTAQYALAPRLLVSNPQRVKPEWVLGNFARPQDFAALGEANHLTMLRDFGNGVVLYRRRAE